MKSSQVTPATLARIVAGLKRHGITNKAVAAEATKTSRRGTVSESAVSRALAWDDEKGQPRSRSANIVSTAKRLIAEAKAGVAA